MATWVIGDVHGCWQTLQALLERIEWQPGRDRLWLVGDLVNRGPSSLEVLRWAHEHRDRLVVVLGNHDLHLLARAAGVAARKKDDVLEEVLAADDREQLLGWLRRRPLMHSFGPYVMVHAGFAPEWNIEFSRQLALAASHGLCDGAGTHLLSLVYSRRKKPWRADLESDQLLASAIAVMTRVRMVGEDGRARFGFSGPPGAAPAGWSPWFRFSAVRRQGYTVIFGHWAMFGLYRAQDVVCLDSGCVYGGRLTAISLDSGRVEQEPLLDDVGAIEVPGSDPER